MRPLLPRHSSRIPHNDCSDGAIAPDGFVCLTGGSTESLLNTWQSRVFKFLVAAGKIDQSTEYETLGLKLWD